METTKHKMISFYQQLARIFYAVAAVDGEVRTEELEQIKRILKTEWILPGNGPELLGTDAVYQIERALDWLLPLEWDTEKAIEEFETFKNQHEELFSAKVTHLILKTLHSIAAAYAGKNKSELVFISRLFLILKGNLITGKN